MPPAPLPLPLLLALPSSASTRSEARLRRKRCLRSFTSPLPHFPTSPLPPPSFFFPFSFAPPPIRIPVLPRSPPRGTPLRSSAPPLLHLHFPAPLLIRSSPPPFFLLPPFLRPSAHSGPRFPAFPAARHSHPQALAVIRQATGREADNRAAEAAGQKNPALTGRTLSGINLYSRKKGEITSRAYECSHPT